MRFAALTMAAALAAPASTCAQDSPAPQQQTPNAMRLYDMACAELARSLQIDLGEWFNPPQERRHPWEYTYRDPAWESLIAKSTQARLLFAQAVRTPRCERDDPGGDFSSFEGGDVMHLYAVGMLVGAHGWKARQDRPETTAEDAISLLRGSRQLGTIEHRDGAPLSTAFEQIGIRLLAATLEHLTRDPKHARIVASCADELATHHKHRLSLAAFAERQIRIMDLQLPRPRAPRANDRPALRVELENTKQARDKALAICRDAFSSHSRNELPSIEAAAAIDRAIKARADEASDAELDSRTREQQVEDEAYLYLALNEVAMKYHVKLELDYRVKAQACRARLRELTRGG